MIITCKDGKREIPPDWIVEWNHVHLNVQEKLIELVGYCRDDGKRVPTKVGLRRFLGSIIRKDCPMRRTLNIRLVPEPKTTTPLEVRLSYLDKMKEAL